MPAFDMVEREWRDQLLAAQQSNDKEGGKGSLIIVGRRDQDKFFSNGKFSISFRLLFFLLKMKPGLDYPNSQKDLNFFQCQLIIYGQFAHSL